MHPCTTPLTPNLRQNLRQPYAIPTQPYATEAGCIHEALDGHLGVILGPRWGRLPSSFTSIASWGLQGPQVCPDPAATRRQLHILELATVDENPEAFAALGARRRTAETIWPLTQGSKCVTVKEPTSIARAARMR